MKKLYHAGWFVVLILAALVLSPGKANAAGDTAPDVTATPGADIHMLISERGTSLPLSASPSYIMMGWPTATANFTIFEGCWGGPRDIFTSVEQRCAGTALAYDVVYEFLQVDSNGRPILVLDTSVVPNVNVPVVLGSVTGAQAGSLPFSGSIPGATFVPSLNSYVVIMRARWVTNNIVPQGRNNMFKVRAVGGEVGFVDTFNEQTFYPGGASPIAFARAPTNSGVFDDIAFHYQAPCDYSLASKGELYLRWQDADAGPAGRPANSTRSFTLNQSRNVAQGGTPVGSFTIDVNQNYAGVPGSFLLGGDGVYREILFKVDVDGITIRAYIGGTGLPADASGRPTTEITAAIVGQNAGNPIQILRGDKFDWQWSGIRGNNGVQMWAPFNTITYDKPCPDSVPTCSILIQDLASNPLPNPAANQAFQVRITLDNPPAALAAPFANYQPGANAAGIHSPPGGFDSPPFSGNPYPNESPSSNNYLVQNTAFGAYNNRYVRINHIFNVAAGSIEAYTATGYEINGVPGTTGFAAPGAAGTYDFNWGFVIPGTGWAPVQCTSSFTIAPQPVTQLTCGSVTPSRAEPSESLSNIAVTFNNASSTGLTGETKTVTIGAAAPVSPAFSWSGPPGFGTALSADMTATMPSTAGTVNVHLTVSGGNSNPNPLNCDYPIRVIAQPYFKVYGGDVRAGSGFSPAAAGPCSANAGTIKAWGNLAAHTGASTEFGAISQGTIDQFGSAGLRAVAPLPPTGLSFANNNIADLWGGNFGANLSSCIPNYWSVLRDAPTPGGTAIDTTINGQRTYSGGACGVIFNPSGPSCVTLGAATPTGIHTAFVNGDLSITGNIGYSPGGWATVTDIPYLTVVVCGNIYIDESVTQLDGWYIAMPRSYCEGAATGPGGTIYTCMNDFGNYDADTMYDACKNSLTIRGSFSAQDIRFQRTFGTVGTSTALETSTYAPNNTAEKFIYNPTSWIAKPAQKTVNTSTATTKIDSITGLPPIL